MNKSAFHKINILFLTTALIFGQVGAGFFHNKHDAHETVTDLDHTVLLPHGEHCKICSVDWAHQFLGTSFDIGIARQEHFVAESTLSYPIPEFSLSLSRDRAPPVIA